MMETAPQAVFLDACVFIGAQFNMRSRDLRSLESLVASGALCLVTTDIVVREVQANIDKVVKTAKSRHDTFRNDSTVAVFRGTAAAHRVLDEIPADELATELHSGFSAYLERTKTQILTTEHLTAGEILKGYFGRQAPFGEGKRKDQFPDAFTVSAVREWQRLEPERSLIFVTSDQAVAEAVQTIEHTEHAKTIRSLLDDIYSEDEPRAHFLKHELLKHREELKKWAADVFADRAFDVEDRFEGEVLGVRVEGVDLTDDPEDLDLVAMDDSSATFLTYVDVELQADIKYGDDDMAPYDSETKSIWFLDYIEETVRHREEDTELEIQVSFQGLDPDRFSIEKIDFPSLDTVFVATSRG